MIGALWTGISGLASHQSALDNESHNIANVNTVGYKASRISFADQMYQDRIGKGSKVLDAEKLYVQGNLRLTGVDYDMALSGDGFFTVRNTRSSGSAENLYTRAGNFRMGDNGTLQDAAGNEVQGWAMRSLDTTKDVVSTNPNADMFTSDYTKLLSSKVIKHSNYVETITAKATDYSQSAKADSDTIFSGAGGKSKSAKISDVEALVASYSSALQKLRDEPDGGSSSSTAQISQINFESGSDGLVSKEGDQVYVFINGSRYSENYVSTIAPDDFNEGTNTNNSAITTAANTPTGSSTITNTITLANDTKYTMTIGGTTVTYKSDSTATMDEILDGLETAIQNSGLATEGITKNTGAGTIAIQVAGATPPTVSEASYNINELNRNASRIETYRALADRISEIPGLRAYMVKEEGAGTINDAFEPQDSFSLSTAASDMAKGIIQIESLIPGESFTITEVGEVSGSNTVAGAYQTSTLAVEGTGVGALESARDALSRAISGKQQDVYTSSDIVLSSNSSLNDYTYSLTIYDKELGRIIPVPNDNGIPAQAVPISIDNVSSIDDFVNKFNNPPGNATPKLSDYVVAKNINGNIVIETLDKNYDVEFSGNLRTSGNVSLSPGAGITNSDAVFTPATSTLDLSSFAADIAGADNFTYTYNIGGGDQTISITNPGSVADIATAIAAHADFASATVSGNTIVITPTSNTVDFTGANASNISSTSTAAVNGTNVASSVTQSTSTITGSSVSFKAGVDFTYTYTTSNGTTENLTIPNPASLNDIATAINGLTNVTATVTGGNIVVTAAAAAAGSNFTASSLQSSAPTNPLPLDKNNDYSGRQGAGAEFIELKNTIDQTTTQSSLQLRLDTLGISDSAFGEFSVDATGLITMKQDGAEFAIGQVSIALFNNNRGLNPSGDNLLAATNDSGEPIYNLNNDKTAKIEGKTLELSTADLSESLVNLMVFQRAFEANAKSITTSDQLLNTLINLKR